MEVYGTIYKKIKKLLPNLEQIQEGVKLKADGYMDLNVDILARTDNHILIALSHYYKQSGDMIPDPDMEVRVSPKFEVAEAMSYQDSIGYLQIYENFDLATGNYSNLDLNAKKGLNSFLNQWLGNLLKQGHKLETEINHAPKLPGLDK